MRKKVGQVIQGMDVEDTPHLIIRKVKLSYTTTCEAARELGWSLP